MTNQEILDRNLEVIRRYMTMKGQERAERWKMFTDDPENPKYTLSFDLLFRGLEVTTGGQRIHDYDQQVQKMLDRGMHPEEFRDFLTIHQHGMPPHGGLGIGLERLTMKLCGLENVREASLFPRDQSRLEP